MAKTNKPAANTDSPENDSPMAIVIKPPTIVMDAQLNMNDIVEYAVSHQEDRLLETLKTTEAELTKATKEHSDAGSRLQQMSQQLMASQRTDSDIELLLATMSKVTHQNYVIKFENPEQASYGRAKEGPITDIDQLKVTGAASVYQRAANDDYRHQTAVFSWPIAVNFTPEMLKQVSLIEEKTKQVSEIHQRLSDLRQQIRDLPRLGRRAKRQVVESVLRGEAFNGAKLLEHITNVRSPLALPAPEDKV